MAKSKQRLGRRAGDDRQGPTPERRRHGDIEMLAHAIADEAGRPSRPHRAVDTLGAMLRRRSITPAMHQAGEDFRALFRAASLDPLRAVDLTRPRAGVGVSDVGLHQSEAREKVWQALKALGGIAAPAGSCVWHVLGCEWSLKDWSLRAGWGGRPLSQEAASGILIGALGVLRAIYGL